MKFLPVNPDLNKHSIVLPLSLRSGKAGAYDGDKVQDLLSDEKLRRGYKNFRGFGVLDGGKIFSKQIKTNMFMHMSHSGEEERLAGRSVDGQIYNYEAIERGATGEFHMLINLRGCHLLEKISEIVARMMKKLQDGIRLGALTTKSFGLVTVENLSASLFDFRDKTAVAAWLLDKSADKKILPSTEQNSVNPKDFIVDADFKFN